MLKPFLRNVEIDYKLSPITGIYPSSFTNVRFLNKDWVF